MEYYINIYKLMNGKTLLSIQTYGEECYTSKERAADNILEAIDYTCGQERMYYLHTIHFLPLENRTEILDLSDLVNEAQEEKNQARYESFGGLVDRSDEEKEYEGN